MLPPEVVMWLVLGGAVVVAVVSVMRRRLGR